MQQRLIDIYEAVGSDEFTALLGEEIYRRLQRAYAEVPGAYREYCSMPEVPDFRNQNIIAISGTEDLLRVRESEEYKELTFSESSISYRVYKYGRLLTIPWEFVVNDDLRGVNRMVDEMGRSARRTVARFAAEELALHPEHATITGALNFANLSAAITDFNSQVNAAGVPLGLKAELLVIPPYWELTAKNILSSVTIAASGVTDILYGTKNVLENALKPVVDPFLTGYDWYVGASPQQADGLELAFLRGYKDNPKLLRRRGDEEGEDMDFYNDSICYKVRHVFGGGWIDTNAFYHIGCTEEELGEEGGKEL